MKGEGNNSPPNGDGPQDRQTERLRDIVEMVSDWYWETNSTGEIVYISEGCEKAFEVSKNQIINKSRNQFLEDYQSDDGETEPDWETVTNLIKNTKPYDGLLITVINRDNDRQVYKISGKPFFDKSGGFLGYREVGRNVTEAVAKRAQIKDAIESFTSGFAMFDKDDRLELYNNHYKRLVNNLVPRSLRVGRTFEELLTEWVSSGAYNIEQEDQKSFLEERLAIHRSAPSQVEVQLADGRWGLASIYKTRSNGTALVLADITERVHSEQKLRRQTSANQLMMDIAVSANEANSVNHALRDCLEKVCEFLGWPIGHVYLPSEEGGHELIPSKIWYVDHPDSAIEFREITEKTCFSLGEGLPGRVWKSAKPTWIQDVNEDPNFPRAKLTKEVGVRAAIAFPALSGSEVVAVFECFSTIVEEPDTVVLDILTHVGTQLGRVIERKRVMDVLNAALLDAERANQTKTDFLAAMSHELRTPLNAVLGFAQILKYDSENPLSQSQNEYVEGIQKGGENLLDLVNQVLNLTKIEANQLSLSLVDLDASKIITECMEHMSAYGASRQIKISYREKDDSLPWINTDPHRFKQILINLISNAIKFNREGGSVTISARESANKFLRVSVTDTGIGIAREDQPSIFEKFHRVGAHATRTREGTGIGLTVSNLLAERLAGRLGLDSEVGTGSTFWFEVPLSINKEALIWDDSLFTGVDQIDKDHQVIISLTNKVLHDDLGDHEIGKIIGSLISYTRFHFQREELIMQVCGYTDLESHRQQHRDLVAKIEGMANTWKKNQDVENLRSLRKFLRDWWVSHIKNVDTKIAVFADGKQDKIAAVLRNI